MRNCHGHQHGRKVSCNIHLRDNAHNLRTYAFPNLKPLLRIRPAMQDGKGIQA
jgi:hypothetical protein